MNYQQTLKYLYDALPMYQRVGIAAYKANLDNTIAICDLLNNPHRQLQCIHVAGTNGKGSVSHMMAAILQAAGYKTGLYTSPHLKDFRERIRVNGKMISKKFISDFVTNHQKDFEKIQPSFFEMTVGLAFQYFLENRVDIAVIETGLGGRLDSTNVIHPILSVITNIDWDHMNLLGDTLEKIASEKAGIIKREVPVVIGELTSPSKRVFIKKAKEMQAPIFFASKEMSAVLAGTSPISKKNAVKQLSGIEAYIMVDVSRKKKLLYENLQLDLTGSYQLKNVVTVLQSIALLKQHFEIREEHIRIGLSTVKSSTGLAGRWHVISRKPLIIADTGHNQAGLKVVLELVHSLSFDNLHFVLGMVNDKDIDKILSLLPKMANYYFCKAAIPRGLDAVLLAEAAASFHLKGEIYNSVKAALKAAKSKAGLNDLIFVGGSNFTVAEVI